MVMPPGVVLGVPAEQPDVNVVVAVEGGVMPRAALVADVVLPELRVPGRFRDPVPQFRSSGCVREAPEDPPTSGHPV